MTAAADVDDDAGQYYAAEQLRPGDVLAHKLRAYGKHIGMQWTSGTVREARWVVVEEPASVVIRGVSWTRVWVLENNCRFPVDFPPGHRPVTLPRPTPRRNRGKGQIA